MNGEADRGMDRIRDEMAANPEDAMMQMIGEHLTRYLILHAEAELKQGATLAGAIDAMRREAGKRRGGRNWAALGFAEGMKVVYETFGLTWSERECMAVQGAAYSADEPAAAPARAKTKAPADEFDLDRLMGG